MLMGAARALGRQTGGTPPPLERELRDRTERSVEEALGAGPFAEACREGEELTQEAAIRLAQATAPTA